MKELLDVLERFDVELVLVRRAQLYDLLREITGEWGLMGKLKLGKKVHELIDKGEFHNRVCGIKVGVRHAEVPLCVPQLLHEPLRFTWKFLYHRACS